MENNFTFREMQNPHVLETIKRVMRLTFEIAHNPSFKDNLIVEGVGWGLEQRDWTDKSWNFVAFRPSPVMSPARKEELIELFTKKLTAEFGTVEVNRNGDNVKVRWGSQVTSIGD